MASSLRREANFWNSQSNQFHKWLDIRETYGSAMDAMPPSSSEQLNDRSSTIPSIHGSVTQVNYYPEFIDVNAYHLISRMLNPIPSECHMPRNDCPRLLPIYKNCG